MKLRLNLKQKQILSQRLQQSLSILSLSNEELEELIRKELLENPFLEKEEAFFLKDKQNFRMYDYLEADFKKSKFTNQESPRDFSQEIESLKSYALKQVQHSFFSDEIKKTVILLISYLGEDAYLRVDLNELSEKEGLSKTLMTEALKALQSFDPVGIGARNLKECLVLQLRQKKISNYAETIVCYYLSALKEKKYPYIAGELNLSVEKTKELCHEIEKLNPNPATNFSSEPTQFVRPDVYIYKQDNSYHVIFNKENLSQVKFSYNYLNVLKKTDNLKIQDKKYFKIKTTEARFFIHAIQQRQKQIKRIAQYIIEHQAEFFEKGVSSLKPLTMADMAKKMSVHVSTISRTVNNKYVHTPYGLFALKSFFVKGAWTLSGQKVSISKIKEHIKKWISEESPKKPLCDEQIKQRLFNFFQVSISRRRIAQYRQNMNIASFRIRKL